MILRLLSSMKSTPPVLHEEHCWGNPPGTLWARPAPKNRDWQRGSNLGEQLDARDERDEQEV